jgi:hypothetical protein
MSRQMALARIIFGSILLAVLYGAPYAAGVATASGRLESCLTDRSGGSDVVVVLDFVPGPSELEKLQAYGRYGGSAGDTHNVVLLSVPSENVRLLSQLYWVEKVKPLDGC